VAQDSTLKFLVAAQVTGQEQIARLINDTDRLNKTTKGLQTAFSQMGGAAKSLSDVQKNAAAIDAARAEKLARLSQEFYNSALSIDRTAKSARDSASAFEEAFQAQEMVAKAQRDAAAAAADLRAKLDPMIPIQNRFNAEMDHAADLLRMGAISQKEYAAATTMARQNLYSAQQALHGMNAAQTGVIVNGVRYNSMADAQAKALRQQRQGTQMLGMQFNDLATSISTGASPITAFNQQIGQVGIAMADMGGKMGAVGKFLIGPWGTALTIATMALGFLAEKFIFNGDSAEKAKSKINDLGQQFDFARMSAEDLARINDLLAESNGKTAQTAIQAARATATQAQSNLNAAQTELEHAKTALIKRRALLKLMQLGAETTGGSAADLLGGAFGERIQINKIVAMEAETDRLSKVVEGFQFRSRKATAEVYTLSSALDKGGKATELHQSRINMLSNAYARGEIDLQRFNEEVDKANRAYEASQKAAERSGGRSGGRGKKVESFANVNFLERDAAFLKASLDKGAKYWADYYDNIELTSVAVLQQIAEDHEMVTAKIQTVGDTVGPIFMDRFMEVQTAFQTIGNSVAGAFQGMLTGAMSWKDGMKGIIQSVINELWRLFVVQKIVGFVTNALTGAAYGGGGSFNTYGVATDIGNKLSSSTQFFMGTMGKNANGTQNWRGGLSLVGERGPEIVNLPRGAQVIPAHRAQGMMGNGVTVNVDARGSADPAAVRAQVEAGILQAAPAIIAAAEARTVQGLRRPRLGGAMK